MSETKIIELSPSARLTTFTDPSFKTMRIAVNMLVPLTDGLTAAQYAILPAMASRATRQHPDYTALGRRLAELYGASLASGVQQAGPYQCLSLSAGGIASQYAFGGEDMFLELTRLLFSVLLEPLQDEEGLFPEDGFEQEKRQLLEQKDAEFSDKMLYAHRRCQEILFAGQPAGIGRAGSRRDIESLRRQPLTEAWNRLLREARFEIYALGNCRPDVEAFQKAFAGLGTPRALGAVTHPDNAAPCCVSEEQPIAQSKLAMAYRVQAAPEERMLFLLASAVLGEPTSSKLFLNVREKQGLCYYCDSAFSWVNSALFIESGVETADLEPAEEAILEQVAALQRGEITPDELRYAQLYLCNSLRAVEDSLHRVESWYLGRTFDQDGLSPGEAINQVMRYTIEDVAAAANRLKPAVVYKLRGEGG